MSQVKEERTITEDHDQDGDTEVKNALAALNEDDDTDLGENVVQEILLAYKESRQLRGKQRVNRGYRPVTGRTVGESLAELRADSTSRNWSHAHAVASVVRKDTGHANAETKENKYEMEKKQNLHS